MSAMKALIAALLAAASATTIAIAQTKPLNADGTYAAQMTTQQAMPMAWGST